MCWCWARVLTLIGAYALRFGIRAHKTRRIDI